MRSGWFIAGVLISGCASNPPRREPAPSPQIATASQVEPTRAAPKSRVFGMLDRRAPIFGYLEGPRFLASPLFRVLLTALREVQAAQPGAPDPLAELNQKCGFDPLSAIRELTFTADPKTEEVTVVVALDQSADRTFACFEGAGTPEPAALAGRKALCRADQCLVADGDLLAFGRRLTLEKLFASAPKPSGAPPAEDYLLVTGAFPNSLGVKRASFAMAPSATSRSASTRLELEGETASPQDAANLEARGRQLLALVPNQLDSIEPELKRVVMTLLERLTLEHRGNTARASIVVEDSILSGALAGLTVYGVKRYLTAAKMSEARTTLGLIAARLERHAEKSPGHRFPRSAPRVPSTVPAGVKYTTTPADWKHKSWSSIEFGLENPQYYSYEYETSKDGKRAVVRARGDLDGDGVESLFELDVTVGESEPSPIRETNPTE